MRVVDVVFVPEAVAVLGVSELSTDDAREGRTNHGAMLVLLRDTGREQVNVVHVT